MPHKDPATRQAYHHEYYRTHRAIMSAQARERYEARRDALGIQPRHVQTPEERAARREEMRAYQRAYRRANLAKLRANDQAYYVKNRTELLRKMQQYTQANPDGLAIRGARYRARKAQAPVNDFTVAQWKELKALWNFCCAYCGKKSTRLSQDHITPLSKGGSHTASNIVPACRSCNSKKRTGPPLRAVQPVLFTLASAKPAQGKGRRNAKA